MPSLIRSLPALALLTLALACGDDGDGGPRVAADIVIRPNAPTIVQGGTRQLNATVVDATGRAVEDQAVQWFSSDEDIATVSATGLVTSLGSLEPVEITAQQGEITHSVDLDVRAEPVEIRVSPDSSLLNVGEQANLVIEVFDFAGNPYPVDDLTLTASSNTIIHLEGITVTAMVPGEATVTIRIGDLVKVVPIVVRIIPTVIETNTPGRIFNPGETFQLTAVVKDRQGTVMPGAAVTYSSTAPSIFTVSNSGLISVQGPSFGGGRVHIAYESIATDVGVYIGAVPSPAVIGTAQAIGSPYAVAVNSSGKTIVTVASGGPRARLGTLSPFAFDDSVTIGSGDSRMVTLNPAGTLAYIATDLGIAVVNMATGAQDAFIPRAGGNPMLSTFVTRDGASLLAGGDGKLYRFSTGNGALTDSVDIHSTLEMVQHPTQPIVYAMNPFAVYEINLNSFEVTRVYQPLQFSSFRGVAVAPDGSELYIANENDELVTVSTTLWHAVSRRIIAGAFGVTVLGDYVVVAGAGRVNFLDRASLVPLKELLVGVDRRPVVAPGGVLLIPSQFNDNVVMVQ